MIVCIRNTINNNVGVIDVSRTLDAIVYPNPVGDKLFAQVDGTIDFTVTLTDMMGRTLYSGISRYGTAEVNTSKLSSGVYLVKIIDQNGASKTIKSIVQH